MTARLVRVLESNGEERWSNDEGALRVIPAPPGVLRTVFVGNMTADFVSPLRMLIDARILAAGRASIWHDWWGLERDGYEARLAMSAFILKRIRAISSLNILFHLEGAGIRMGVRACNMVLGGRMTVFDDRALFDAELERALARVAF